MPIVGEDGEPTVVAHADKLLPTAEDIENMQQQAYQEAYEQAYQEAHAEGLEAGKKEGHAIGFEEGKAEGFQQGLKDGEVRINAQSAQIHAILQTLTKPLEQLDAEVEEELVLLAMATARHLLRRELKIQPTHVIAAVRQAVDLLPISTQNIRVFLHPEDAALLRDALAVSNEEEQRWKIVEDPMITRGGCNVETDTSRIDASIETRINSVIAQVLGDERASPEDENESAEQSASKPSTPAE